MNLNRISKVALWIFAAIGLFLTGCLSNVSNNEALNVGSYNIRLATGDVGTPNAWNNRKDDLVDLVKKLDLDVFGMQEVRPEQAKFLRERMPDYEFVGEHRGADRVSDEASPVAYRKSRFEKLKSGTFWLSETPEVPGVKGWGAACPRVCSYLILRDLQTGKRFCFANTHTDHISALARKNGMLLIIERMKEFGGGVPIVFTGDHNCRHEDEPAQAARELLSDARDIAETKDPGPMNTFQGFGKYKDGPVDKNGKHFDDYRIDYIYVTPGTRVINFVTHDDKRAGKNLYPSDHYPITATIEL